MTIAVRVALFALALVATPAASADADLCGPHLPDGLPSLAGGLHTTLVCNPGYAAMHDDDLLVPRWVAYRLTGDQTLGCEKRGNNFHAETALPKARRATPADYTKTGYDKGHQAPAADFAHDKDQISDSFSMVNMAPQLPGLNRQQWERLEETVRAWAWARGEVSIYVGPIMGPKPKKIGKNKVAVPQGFWKAIIDRVTNESVAFVMPQRSIPKQDLAPWQTSVSDIERGASIDLRLPETIDRSVKSELWASDRKGWNGEHSAACK